LENFLKQINNKINDLLYLLAYVYTHFVAMPQETCSKIKKII